MAQHHFYHWLHIRALYESQFSQYVAAGGLLPLDIRSDTVTAAQPLSFDSYRVHLTTTTTTVMPHATATTSTSTSYQQLTSDVLCLPPSPPLLALAGFVPPAPFSYDFTYPSHPFSYPPAAVLEVLPAELRDQECWGSLKGEEEADLEQEATEYDGEDEEAEELNTLQQEPQPPQPTQQAWPAASRWLSPRVGRGGETEAEVAQEESQGQEDEEAEEDGTNDSDDEWSVGGADADITEIDMRSSYAPSYAPSYACSDAEDEDEEEEAEEQRSGREEAKVETHTTAAAAAALEMRIR